MINASWSEEEEKSKTPVALMLGKTPEMKSSGAVGRRARHAGRSGARESVVAGPERCSASGIRNPRSRHGRTCCRSRRIHSHRRRSVLKHCLDNLHFGDALDRLHDDGRQHDHDHRLRDH